MADAAHPEESPRPEPPFPWYGGLSARLLLLTVLIVVVANVLILPPYLAAYEEQWLLDRLRAAELATLVEETAPGGVVTDRVRAMLLANAEVVSVALQADGERRLILQAPRLKAYTLPRRSTPWRTAVVDRAHAHVVGRRRSHDPGHGQAPVPRRRIRRDRRARRTVEAPAAGAAWTPDGHRGVHLHHRRRRDLSRPQPVPGSADAANHEVDGTFPRRSRKRGRANQPVRPARRDRRRRTRTVAHADGPSRGPGVASAPRSPSARQWPRSTTICATC